MTFRHIATVVAQHAPEDGQEGRWDVLQEGGTFSVFDQGLGLYVAADLPDEAAADALADALADAAAAAAAYDAGRGGKSDA